MLADLRLQYFRSYDDASFEFSPGVNIIVGPNASGKTNLLEAILVLARGNSYRVRDNELVGFGHKWARVDSHLTNGANRSLKLHPETLPNKVYELDGKSYKRLTLGHSLPVVLFEPNHLQLLSGSPERRRDYLDDLLEQMDAGYGPLRRQYRRTLAQRNALLKHSAEAAHGQLFAWDIRLSQLAGKVVRSRSELVEQLNASLPALYAALSGAKTRVSATYSHQWPIDSYETQLMKKLETSLELDRQRGFTGAGPHREDVTVLFDDRPAQQTASRGELRTAVLGLKIIELKIIEAARDGQAPLLLLDDVFSELDGKRRHALTDYLAPYQTFITTTDADLVLEHFTESCHVIPLG
jgi:DNA replication and repair protein RecF